MPEKQLPSENLFPEGIPEKNNDVLGIGNALMDFLVEAEDHQLLDLDLKKGEMHLVDEKKAHEILSKIEKAQLSLEKVPGGSSANTLKGLAFLGGKALLYGKVGQDENGLSYVEQMKALRVKAKILTHQKHLTGHALTFITPDAQRTFSVHLGAAVHLLPEEILEEDIQESKILHLEGYQLEGDTQETILRAMELARKHGTLISLDLADPGVVRRNRKLLQKIVQDYVDILFVNEKEAQEFTGLGEEQAAIELGKMVKVAIVKIGAKGSILCSEEGLCYIAPFPAQAIDTTGAGDTYAAGFLYGCCQGWPIEKAGELGSLLASKVVEQKGVKLSHLHAEELKKRVMG